MPRPDASAKLAAHKHKEGPPKILIAAVIAAVVIIAMVVVVIVNSQSDSNPAAAGSTSARPEGGGITVFADKAGEGAPEVDVYEDFQCPWCGLLERSAGDEMTELAQAGDIKLTYHIMSFLDGNLGNDASHRATNAALCADDAGAFVEYHQAVYANQPAQEGQGWTDEELLGFAKEAGITGAEHDDFATCLQEDAHGDYVEAMQTSSDEAGVTGTPRVMIDGEPISDEDMNTLMQDGSHFNQLVQDAQK